jgi:hypothetical protein
VGLEERVVLERVLGALDVDVLERVRRVLSSKSMMSCGVTPRKRACGTQKNWFRCTALPEPTFSVR